MPPAVTGGSPGRATAPRQVVFISPVPPRADGTGIEQRAWSHLEALARVAEVHLIMAVTAAQVQRGLELAAARDICSDLSLVRLQASWKMAPRRVPGLTLASRLATLGRSAYRVDSSHFDLLRRGLRDRKMDLVFCFRLRSFWLWEQLGAGMQLDRALLFVDFDDLEAVAIRREIPYERGRVGLEQSWVARIDAIDAALLEARARRVADMVGVCSEVDRQQLQSAGCRAAIAVVPNSYPLPPVLPLRPTGPVGRLLFVGNMAYAPNADALIYFCDEILPLIRQSCSRNVELIAVGRNPGPRVRALAADPAIKVTGGVESVQPYYDEADLVVAPIRSGGGTRIKILEALAFRRAVVSTTLGAEGLDLLPDRDLSIADTPAAFARACVALLEDDHKRHQLAIHGREQVAAVYDRRRVQNGLLAAIFDSRAGLSQREENRTK